MTDLPPVKRARGAFLYSTDGRWLDLWRAGGRALFGWRERRVMRRYKAVLSAGLCLPYPSRWHRRLWAQLGRRFPGRVARPISGLGSWPVGFPWLLPQDCPFVLVLPDLGLARPLLISSAPPPEPEEDLLACQAAALVAALGAWEAQSRRGEESWQAWEVPGWVRKGPWLFFQGSPEEYRELRHRLLAERILLPPGPEQPACLPFEDLPAECRRWRRLWSNRGLRP